MDELRTHYNRQEHEDNVLKHRVKAIWMNTGGRSEAVEAAEAGSVTQNLGTEEIRSRSTSPISLSSDTSLPEVSMPDVVPKSTASDRKCVLCNMTFVSTAFTRKHLDSNNHEARAVFGRHPVVWNKLHSSTRALEAEKDGKNKSYSCFLCWVSFAHPHDLSVHYKTSSHKRQVRRNGVRDFIEDFTVDLSSSQIEDFVVLDEVGSGDEVTESKKEALDTSALDDVSSSEDEELAKNNVTLEDVNSPEQEETEPNPNPDQPRPREAVISEGLGAEDNKFDPLSEDEGDCLAGDNLTTSDVIVKHEHDKASENQTEDISDIEEHVEFDEDRLDYS